MPHHEPPPGRRRPGRRRRHPGRRPPGPRPGLGRDPDFDRFRHPRSQFQEVFSWLVPNVSTFGGRFRDCLESLRGEADGDEDDNDRAAGRAAEQARISRRVLASVSRAEARELAAKHQIIAEARP